MSVRDRAAHHLEAQASVAYARLNITVSAVSSVTADPPVLLACIHRDSPACGKLCRDGIFCINMLEDSQSEVADVFAGRGDREAIESNFDCTLWSSLVTGARDAGCAVGVRLPPAEEPSGVISPRILWRRRGHPNQRRCAAALGQQGLRPAALELNA
ncbi:MAG TPA: flavin reductase family protein [Gammaproteobacteria bacterium]|nr:flavin reductase family protein [Gammaproteobacteria bacterium]